MRIAVTGTEGQIARSLVERGRLAGIEIVTVGRPQLDLTRPETIYPALEPLIADAIINAAAYTAVDQAEANPEAAFAVNAAGAGYIAQAGHRLNVPVLQLSTDYVFAGSLERPYREDDPAAPISVYGASKLAGEKAVLEAGGTVLRTAWVYSPFGRNFVKTMMSLAACRDDVSVVADQIGCPTSALDIADGLIGVSRRQAAEPRDAALRGVFHMTGAESTSWHGFASGIFDAVAGLGGSPCNAVAIPASAYPTAAQRPVNSRLDGAKLRDVFGLALPGWRASLPGVVARIVSCV